MQRHSSMAVPRHRPRRHWWIPPGRVFLSPDSNDTAARNTPTHSSISSCRADTAIRSTQQSAPSGVTYDAYDLLMVETRDALGNRVTVGDAVERQHDSQTAATTTACCNPG